MGRAVVHDLARSGLRVRLLDREARDAARIARRYGDRRTESRAVDAHDGPALRQALQGVAVVVNCAPYPMNPTVMEAALQVPCHYLDLGGLFHTTRRQLEYDEAFRRRGLLAVLGMGSAPGITNVLARAAAARLRRVTAIRVYNGGVSFTPPRGPLSFAFSAATVLDELTLRPMVFARGRFRSAPPRLGRRGLPLRRRAPARPPEPAFRGRDPAPVLPGAGPARVQLQARPRPRRASRSSSS